VGGMELQTWIARRRESLRQLGQLATRNLTPSIRDFAHAVTTRRGDLAVVAELARATPEEGAMPQLKDIAALASDFDEAGVSALAVATDPIVCEGSTADLRQVSAAASVPVIARDLFVRPEQIYEARLFGADAVLLIAEAVRPDELLGMMEIAASLHMTAAVEVRSEAELSMALRASARVVVLPAFDERGLSLASANSLLSKVPRSVTPIVRGPFTGPQDFEGLKGQADAIWIAKPILEANNPQGFLASMVEAAENG
jgi:indole-3-glycerol phosphate synthase